MTSLFTAQVRRLSQLPRWVWLSPVILWAAVFWGSMVFAQAPGESKSRASHAQKPAGETLTKGKGLASGGASGGRSGGHAGGGSGGGSGGGGVTHGPPPAMVRVGRVRRELLQARWDVVGRLVERHRSIVAAEQAGKIMAMAAEEGDVVHAGKTILAQIDDVWAKLQINQARAVLDQAKAAALQFETQLAQARRDLHYYETLLAKRSAKPKEVEDATTAVHIAEARLAQAHAQQAQAQAQLDLAYKRKERLAVRAPFDGVVVRRHTEVGQWVRQGDPVLELSTVGPMDALVDVPEKLIHFLKVGQLLPVLIEPLDESRMGRVQAIIPDGSVAARAFPVKIRLANKDHQLKVGMSVIAHLPTGKHRPTLTVPRDAVLRTGRGSSVWVNLKGKAVPIGVRVLFGHQDRYAIKVTSPGVALVPGMQVVIEGAERLFPMRPLLIRRSTPVKLQVGEREESHS